ncbi:MAG: hypothetical protein SV186_01060 [Candidatus Nanohaloarchaea archaeon]|nr:hypothetical protein [Candidatus Nanohaloarchaea archaeon]
MRRTILALFLAIGFTATASAVPWTISSAWTAPQNISNNSELVTVMQVLEDGEPVIPSDCSTLQVLYNYNTSENQNMTYIPGSAGYYSANLTVSTRDTNIDLFAEGTCDGLSSDGTATDSVSFDPGRNLTVTLINETSASSFLEGQSYSIWVNVTHDGVFESNSDVGWTIYNWTGDVVHQGGFYPRTGYFNASITMPTPSKYFYYLTITAQNNTNVGYVNATGGTSAPLIVYPQLQASLTLNNTAGACDSTVSTCEKGSSVNVTYNVTRGTADNVTGWVTGNGNNLTSFNLTKDGQVWAANFTIPEDFNTSVYGTELTTTSYGWNELSSSTVRQVLTVRPFELIEETASYVFQGSDIDLVFGPVKPFTGLPIPRESIDRFGISLKYPNGTEAESAIVGGGGIPNDNYISDQRLLKYTYSVDGSAPTGTWTFTTNVTDIYGVTREKSFTFDVYDAGAERSNVTVYDISSGISELQTPTKVQKQFDSPGYKTGSIVLKNTGERDATVRIKLSDSLAGLTGYDVKYLNGPPIDLAAGSAATVEFNFSLQQYKQYQGDITFDIEGARFNYQRIVPVNFTIGAQASCAVQNGTLCVGNRSIDLELTSTSATVNISVTNTGDSTTISYTPGGNLSDILSPGSVDYAAGTRKDLRLALDTSQETEGFYSGNITLENSAGDVVEIPTTFNVTIPTGELSLSIDPSDIGTHIIGANISFSATISNTGEVELTDLALTNDALGLDHQVMQDGETVTVRPGESITEEVTLDTEDAATLSRSADNPLTITVSSGSGVEGTAGVQITLLQNLSRNIKALSQTLSDLRDRLAQLNNTTQQSQIEDIRNRIQNMEQALNQAEQAWENDNYEQALSEVNSASQLEAQIDNAIQRAQAASQNQNDGNGTQTNGDSNQDNGGGFNILLIIVPLVILGVIGVIVYLSIVPESDEGEGQQLGSPPPRRGNP